MLRRKTRLEDLINVKTMSLSRTTSNSSFDFDEFCVRKKVMYLLQIHRLLERKVYVIRLNFKNKVIF